MYDKQYADWKDWDLSRFGSLSAELRSYFRHEMGRSGISAHQEARVLEIGYGNGAFLEFARRQGWSIMGVEANQSLVETAIRAGYEAYPTESIRDLAAGSFDAIVAFDVIEHMSKTELMDFFAEVRRLLTIGGVFLARFPNGDSPNGLANQNGDISHQTSIGSRLAEYLAASQRLDVVFLGGQAQPVLAGSTAISLYRFVAVPVRLIINVVLRLLFFPRSKLDVVSSNLILVCRKSS